MADFNAVLARNTDNAPRFEGVCSQTAAFSHYNNLSMQLPLDPATGQLIEGGVKEQAERCFAHVKAIVESINHSLDDVVRVTIFVTDIADLDAVNSAYAAAFGEYRPTRTVVGVAALPHGASVAVDTLITNGVGTIPNAPQAGDLIKAVKNVDRAPKDEFSSHSVAFSHYNNISAQLPIDPATGVLVSGGAREQAAQCLANIKAILEGIDVPFDDIVKITIFTTDLANVAAIDEAYSTFFPDSAIARAVGYVPARTVLHAAALPMGAQVQIEAVVSHGDGTPPQEVEDRHGIVIWASDTDAAPQHPLSTQTVAFSHYNHISAQGPIDPATGAVVGGTTAEQVTQCLKNLKAIVGSIDHVLADTVKINLYLTDLADLPAVDKAYAAFFPEGTPARRVVSVGALAEGTSVLLDAVVANAEGTPPRS